MGPFWHRDAEIDLVWRTADRRRTYAQCQWTQSVVGERELEILQQKAASLPADWQPGLRFVLLSRRGFSERLRRQEDGERLVLVGLEELCGEIP